MRETDGTRQRVSETVRAVSRREAERILRDRLNSVEAGDYVSRSRETVRQYLDKWLETYGTANVSPRTRHGYMTKFKAHAFPTFGDLELQRLTPDTIQNLYTRMLDRGLSARSVIGLHRPLRQALSHAVRQGLLVRNPADAVQLPRPEKRQVQMWTAEETERFLVAASDAKYLQFFQPTQQKL